MTTTASRQQAELVARKYGLGDRETFVDLLTSLPPDQLEPRARAIAEELAEERRAGHRGRTEARGPTWFLGPIVYRSTGVRRSPVGVDVSVAGRHYAGGRYHGPLTAAQVAELEAAGYASRLCPHPPGSPEASKWEDALPITSPADPLEAVVTGS